MGNTTQENDKVKQKGGAKYKIWTVDETKEVLKLMVDSANRGYVITIAY